MARNPKNRAACNLLAAAISTARRMGVAAIEDDKALVQAYSVLLAEPPECRADCKYRGRHQKCNCCARNYRNMKDCYEKSVTE